MPSPNLIIHRGDEDVYSSESAIILDFCRSSIASQRSHYKWTLSDVAALMPLWSEPVQPPVTILTISSSIAVARTRSCARVRLLIGCGVKMMGYSGAPHRLAMARDVAHRHYDPQAATPALDGLWST